MKKAEADVASSPGFLSLSLHPNSQKVDQRHHGMPSTAAKVLDCVVCSIIPASITPQSSSDKGLPLWHAKSGRQPPRSG